MVKRAGDLFDQICDRENLRCAFHLAMKGKRHQAAARNFAQNLDDHLASMAQELQSGTLHVGQYHQFLIRDPKERVITAPCFRERVLHQAVMRVCEPIFERWLIDDTYACRRGKGRLVALARAQQFAGRHAFFLKLDVRKYFDSIPHTRLLALLERRFKERRLLALFERIVCGFRGTKGHGLPIGSLTSQHFANGYLGPLDRFVKERLRMRGYVRYMDDMVIWGDTSARLGSVLRECTEFLRLQLGLSFKDTPYVNRVSHGMDFLGCRMFRSHMVPNRRSRVRYRRQLVDLEAKFASGEITEWELQQRATA